MRKELTVVEQLQRAIESKQKMIKILGMDGTFLCEVDRDEAIRLQAAIIQLQIQLNQLLN